MAQSQPEPVATAVYEVNLGWGRHDVVLRIKGEEVVAFSYYTDELSFGVQEFLGLTLRQAQDLFHARDVAYLKS